MRDPRTNLSKGVDNVLKEGAFADVPIFDAKTTPPSPAWAGFVVVYSAK
jgi:hypothetical protein